MLTGPLVVVADDNGSSTNHDSLKCINDIGLRDKIVDHSIVIYGRLLNITEHILIHTLMAVYQFIV